MRLATGHPPPPRVEHGPRRAFTLVELVVVLSLMVIVISVAAPTFKAFLKGRDLENEARRMLSLTHYGAIRAVSEGLPVDLWINVKQGRYGLAACGGYTESKTNAVSFYLNNESDAQKQSLQLQVSQPPGMLTTASNFWTPSTARRGGMPVIRFQPDGFISDTSPKTVKFAQGTDPEIWLVENTNHTRYEIQLNHAKSMRY